MGVENSVLNGSREHRLTPFTFQLIFFLLPLQRTSHISSIVPAFNVSFLSLPFASQYSLIVPQVSYTTLLSIYPSLLSIYSQFQIIPISLFMLMASDRLLTLWSCGWKMLLHQHHHGVFGRGRWQWGNNIYSVKIIQRQQQIWR